MPTLCAEDIDRIKLEFDHIEVEAGQLLEYLQTIGAPPPARDTPEHWRHTHVCGSATEKIYSGIERSAAATRLTRWRG